MAGPRTRPLLVRQPWELDRWRESLRGRAGGVELAWPLGTLRLTPEPLIREDGNSLQAIRIAALDGELPDRVVLLDEGGVASACQTEPGPGGSLRALVPAVDRPTDVRLRLSRGAASGADLAIVLPLVRRWTIHLIHHSHLDIGYTDPQPVVLQQQGSYLDSALDLVEATDAWPDDARFRWCAESLWPFQRWVATRPEPRVEAMIERVRERRIELSAMPFNLHTEACSTAELFELLRGARDVAERWDVPLVSAMQTDVPGAVAGLPDALGEAGVRYLSVAHNWAGRAVPHLVGGDALPRLFRWRGAAGHEVLVWMTDTPHGLAYGEGALLGLCDDLELADDLLPAYLGALASNPYPYAGDLFGWAAASAPVERTPYPHDLLHLRVTGRLSDNTPPRRVVAEIVRDWAQRWSWPRLRLSTNADFFEAAEATLGDRIPTLSGDWNDWWADGLGSGAQAMALQRESQAMALDAATLTSLADAIGAGAAAAQAVSSSRATYEALALFDEHTWGAQDPWGEDDVGPRSGRRQWHWKVARALDAHDHASDALTTALQRIGERVAGAADALATLAVVNTCGWTRTDVVTAFLPEAMVPLDVPVAVIDARDGRSLPLDVGEPRNPVNHDSGRVLRVLVTDVPAVGIVRLHVVAHPRGAEEPAASASEPGAAEAPTTEASPLLSNGRLVVRLDLARASIASIVDVRSGREIVSQESAFGFASYVYDRYAAAGRFNHASSRLEATERLELLGSRSLSGPAVITSRTSSQIAEVITFEARADGARLVATTVTLPRHAGHLDIDVRVSKEETAAKESAYVAFPFGLTDPTLRVDVAGTIVGSGIETIPGSAPHMRAMREWISLAEGDLAVAWATRDAPLVHMGGLPLPFAPFPPTIEPEPGTIVSWIHDNVWDTNFPAQQGMDRVFRYRVAVDADAAPGHGPILAHRSGVALSRPLLAVLARGTVGSPATSEGLLQIDDPAVELVDVVALASDALLVRLRCLADEPVSATIRCGLPIVGAARATYLGASGEDLPLRDGAVRVGLAPRAVSAVLLRLERPGT